jgi:hypothetical protein
VFALSGGVTGLAAFAALRCVFRFAFLTGFFVTPALVPVVASDFVATAGVFASVVAGFAAAFSIAAFCAAGAVDGAGATAAAGAADAVGAAGAVEAGGV